MTDPRTPLAYPTPAQYLYALLNEMSVDDLGRRFARWRFTAREIESLIALQPLAHRRGSERFAEELRAIVDEHPDDYPPVLRSRPASLDLDGQRHRFAELLKGKRVVLVGPSQSIAGSGQGDTLEGFDLIVRLNFQWPIPTALVPDAGRRMDILYHCCNGDLPVTRLFQPGFERTQFVCWQFGIESHALQDHCRSAGVPELEVSSVFEEVLSTMHAFPTTGTVALFHLLAQDIEQLYVTGMTFFRDPYHDGYLSGGHDASERFRRGQTDKVGIHDVPAQLDFVRRLQANDSRLIVDARLAEILLMASRTSGASIDAMHS